ncbi:MAG TPA: spore coat U domain-containing protein [Pseudolabrys sp.]|nr:spore coat U domain-containing protein [Pseudolabrys sp.]
MRRVPFKAALVVVVLLLPSASTRGAFVTTNFQVQITITDACVISGVNDLDFGSQSSLASAVTSTSTFNVNCTLGLPYTIGLSVGGGAGATTATRLMTGPGGATVTYSLYQDVAHTLVWGSSIGTDTVAAVGTGLAVPYTVYGQVPAQSTPATGTYTDTITITVTY